MHGVGMLDFSNAVKSGSTYTFDYDVEKALHNIPIVILTNIPLSYGLCDGALCTKVDNVVHAGALRVIGMEGKFTLSGNTVTEA